MTPVQSNSRELKIGAVLSYIHIVLNILATLAYMPLMLRILGKAEYGVYSLSLSVVGYLALLNFGFSGAYIKFFTKYRAVNDDEALKKLNGIYVLVFGIISLIVMLAGSVFIANVELFVDKTFSPAEIELTRVLLGTMTVNVAVVLINSAFSSAIVAYERFIFGKLLAIAERMCTIIFSVIILWFGYRSVGLSCVTLIISIGALLVSVYYCRKKLDVKFSFVDLDWSVVGEIINFSIYLVLWSIYDLINWQVGKLVLAGLCGSVAVAIFALGVQFNQLFITFSVAVAGVFTPRIYNLAYEKDYRRLMIDLMIKVGRIQFYIVFAIWMGFVAFGREFIVLWAGEGYEESYYVALLLMTPITLGMTQHVGIDMIRSLDKHRGLTWMNIAVATLNAAIVVPLTRHYGVLGCAISTCITHLLAAIVLNNAYYYFYIGLEIPRFFKAMAKFIPAMILVGGYCYIIKLNFTVDSWVGLITQGICYLFVYAVIMWFMGANDYEKGLVRQLARKAAG